VRRDVLNSGVHMTYQNMCARGVGSSCKQVETYAGCWGGGGREGDLVQYINSSDASEERSVLYRKPRTTRKQYRNTGISGISVQVYPCIPKV
jgi:hypothetical protein